MKRSQTWMIAVLFLVLGACGKPPEPEVTSAPPPATDKPLPEMKPLVPLDPALKTVLEKAGIESAGQRYDVDEVTFQGPANASVSLSSLKGKVVLLNLWATWCPPCRQEMPSFDRVYQKLKDRPFSIVAVSVGEKTEIVGQFLKDHPYQFPIFWDPDNNLTASYNTGSIPTTYILAKDGRIVGRVIGAKEWDAPALDPVWAALFQERS